MSTEPTKLTPTGLAALLCARICHDLVSPVAALSTALEVLDDESNRDMHEDALDLVRLSSKQAAGKLTFLRLAFGAGGSAPGIISAEELKSHVDGMYDGGKAKIQWGDCDDGIEKSAARILLNLVMLAVQSVPRGGTITINARQADSMMELDLVANGPKARLDPAIEKTLGGRAPDDSFDGRTIQPFYTGMMVRELGGQVTAMVDGETVSFSAKIPR